MPGHSARGYKVKMPGLTTGSLLLLSTHEQTLQSYQVWHEEGDWDEPIVPVRAEKLANRLLDYQPIAAALAMRLHLSMEQESSAMELLDLMGVVHYQAFEVFRNYQNVLDCYKRNAGDEEYVWELWQIHNAGDNPNYFWDAQAGDYVWHSTNYHPGHMPNATPKPKALICERCHELSLAPKL